MKKAAECVIVMPCRYRSDVLGIVGNVDTRGCRRRRGKYMIKVLLAVLNRMRVVFWLVLVIAGAAALGLGIHAKRTQAEANIASLQQTEEARYFVTALPLRLGTHEKWKSYYGKTKAARNQEVTSWVREVVYQVKVRVGDRVKKGQTVVTLLKTDHSVKAQAGRAGYEEARLNHSRLLELNKRGGVAQSEVDKAYAAMKNEEANARASLSTLQRTDLKASIDGVVSSRNVEPGEVAEIGRSLVSIVDLSDMEAELMVSKNDIHNINRETPVELFVGNTTRKGWVKFVSPEAQAGSGLYSVVVGLGADSGILPGIYLEGRFMVEKKTDVVSIPSSIVIYRGDEEFVYLAEGDRVKRRKITTGEGGDGTVIATSGLKPGDMLVISGNRTLFDGALVSTTIAAESE
jgi:RND family efflux transporter MFP subunit